MSKIYIVEDDENIRELVVYALNSNGIEAHGFERAADFFEVLKGNCPELILLDIMLPDEDGISILKQLKNMKQTAKIPVIMLSAKSGEYDKVKGLDLGADDYITKPFSVLELLSRIKAVLRRSDDASKPLEIKQTVDFKDIKLDAKRHSVKAENEEVVLTFKEFELLQFLLENQGIVLSRDKIMDRVWGFDFQGESRTVDMHIKTLRHKLGKSGEVIKTVRGVGYKVGE